MELDLADLWYEEVVAPKSHGLSKKGYAILYVPKCPLAWQSGKLARCRYVAWAMGWLTSKRQVVHHKNYDKLDDRPSNLSVVEPEWHSTFHGQNRSEETRRKISESQRGRPASPERIARMRQTLLRRYAAGELKAVVTDEQKEKIRQSLLGKKHTEERRKNQSEAHKGIKLSEQAKRKLSEANKGRRITWGDKISATHRAKGIKPSAEAIENARSYLVGRKISEEERAWLSAGSRKRWDARKPILEARNDEMRILYGAGWTHGEMAAHFGISRAAVSRVMNQGH